MLSWTNTAPQDGKDTLDCHFSHLKRARLKFVRHRGDIETPADIVKALSTVASTTAGTTMALVKTAAPKNVGMKGRVVKVLGARTVHCYIYPKATAKIPRPCPVVCQHNGLVGAGRTETVAMSGRQARLQSFLERTKWRSTEPAVLVSSASARPIKKDSAKEALAKGTKKTKAAPVKKSNECCARKNKPKTTEWKLAVARTARKWSQKTKATVDDEHKRALNRVPTDPAVTVLPVGDRGWGKVFVLPRVQLPEVVLSQLRSLFKATKISAESAAAEVHRSHPGNVAVKYHCTAARVKTFFAQLTKAKKQNVDLDLVGLYTELEGYASESCASLQRQLQSRDLKTAGRKAVLISRLERNDERKSTIADYAPGKIPGSGSKSVAEIKVALLAANLPTRGIKNVLVQRLDDHNDALAAQTADSNMLAAPDDGASDPLPDTSMLERDETDESRDVAANRVVVDADVEDPELDPGDFDGVDQEDLLS